MKLETNDNVLSIKENISTVADFDSIKDALEELKKTHNYIILKIYDSLVINSSLIGFLVKIINQDKVRLDFYAGSEILFELLDDLGLADAFNLKKM